MLLTIAFLLVVASQVHGHSYHFGNCPVVKPMEKFDMKKFLGKWYVIQKTSTSGSCLLNDYKEDPEKPGHYKLEQTSEVFLLGVTSSDGQYHYTGDLTAENKDNPADMTVRFPLNVAGTASYKVFTTDYDTYAGIFTCQKLTFAHRSSTTILSRTKSLSQEHIDKIRAQIAEFGVDPYELNIIKQEFCTKAQKQTNDTNIGQRIGETFRKAGEKIEGGVQAVGNTAKEIFTKFRGDHGESKEDLNVRDMKGDAEWLPLKASNNFVAYPRQTTNES